MGRPSARFEVEAGGRVPLALSDGALGIYLIYRVCGEVAQREAICRDGG